MQQGQSCGAGPHLGKRARVAAGCKGQAGRQQEGGGGGGGAHGRNLHGGEAGWEWALVDVGGGGCGGRRAQLTRMQGVLPAASRQLARGKGADAHCPGAWLRRVLPRDARGACTEAGRRARERSCAGRPPQRAVAVTATAAGWLLSPLHSLASLP